MKRLVNQLQLRLPKVSFQEGEAFCWSPKDVTITFRSGGQIADQWSLLHEAAHALAGHQTYASDLELLLMEVEAWDKARTLGEEFGVIINEDHIQDCLDTYRDWLHQRSTCPRCSVVSLQISPQEYLCHNCDARWQVSASRFCRPYRLIKHPAAPMVQTGKSVATFQ